MPPSWKGLDAATRQPPRARRADERPRPPSSSRRGTLDGKYVFTVFGRRPNTNVFGCICRPQHRISHLGEGHGERGDHLEWRVARPPHVSFPSLRPTTCVHSFGCGSAVILCVYRGLLLLGRSPRLHYSLSGEPVSLLLSPFLPSSTILSVPSSTSLSPHLSLIQYCTPFH